MQSLFLARTVCCDQEVYCLIYRPGLTMKMKAADSFKTTLTYPIDAVQPQNRVSSIFLFTCKVRGKNINLVSSCFSFPE